MNELKEKVLIPIKSKQIISTRIYIFIISILLISNAMFAYKSFSLSQLSKNPPYLDETELEQKDTPQEEQNMVEDDVTKELTPECELSDTDINSKLIIDDKNQTSQDPETGARTIPGIWSDDCKMYVYGIEPHYLDVEAAKEISGIWMYLPEEDKNEKIVSLDPDGNRQKVASFLTKNLVDAAGYVINIKTKTIVDEGLEVHW